MSTGTNATTSGIRIARAGAGGASMRSVGGS